MQKLKIHDPTELKLLILYVAARLISPVDFNTLWTLVFIDDGVTYFDFCESLDALVETGHITLDDSLYRITQKGRDNGAILEDIVSESLKKSADSEVSVYNRKAKRDSMIRSDVKPRSDGSYSVFMAVDDDTGNLATIELMAPSLENASRISENFKANAELIFKNVLNALLPE